jgi:cell division protein FtsQ
MVWALVLVCIGGAAAAAAAAWRWFNTAPQFVVTRVIVTHASHVSTQEIMSHVQIVPGTRLAALDPALIRQRIRTIPWVKDVVVRRAWPGTLVVRVQERVPFALVGVGRVYQVDREGMLLPMDAGHYLSLPLITGMALAADSGAPRLAPESLTALLRFMGQLAAADAQLARRVAQLDRGAGVWRIMLEDAPVVLELPDGEIAEKVKQTQRVLALLAAHPDAGIKTVNCRYRNLAFVN